MARVPERIASGIYCVVAIGLSNSISVLLIDGDDGWIPACVQAYRVYRRRWPR
jgi:hypothetical protein